MISLEASDKQIPSMSIFVVQSRQARDNQRHVGPDDIASSPKYITSLKKTIALCCAAVYFLQ